MIPGLQFDPEDEAIVRALPWRLSSQGYATAVKRINGKHTTFLLAREIMKPGCGLVVDHINGDRLDNRRFNLRCVTPRENWANRPRSKRNTSGYRGVYRASSEHRHPWGAVVARKHLGFFQDLMLAAAFAATYRAIYLPGART